MPVSNTPFERVIIIDPTTGRSEKLKVEAINYEGDDINQNQSIVVESMQGSFPKGSRIIPDTAENQKFINKLARDVAGLSGGVSPEVTTLMERIAALEARVTLNEEAINAIDTTGIATNTTSIASLESRLTIAESDVGVNYDSILDAEFNISNNIRNITANTEAIAAIDTSGGADLEDRLSMVESDVSSNTRTIADHSSWIDFVTLITLPGFQSTLTGIQNRLTTVETDISTANSNITAHDLDIVQVRADISGLETDVTTNTTNITANTTAIAGLNISGITTNATNIANLSARVAENEEDIADNTSNISTNTNNISGNDADISQLRTDIDAIDVSGVTALTARVTTAEATISDHTVGIANNANAFTGLEQRLVLIEFDVIANTEAIANSEVSDEVGQAAYLELFGFTYANRGNFPAGISRIDGLPNSAIFIGEGLDFLYLKLFRTETDFRVSRNRGNVDANSLVNDLIEGVYGLGHNQNEADFDPENAIPIVNHS